MRYGKLREIRNQKEITAREMADLLGLVTEAAYYKKETGAIKFTLEEAKLVSDKLGMPINQIFFAEEVAYKDTDTDQAEAM